MKKFKNTNFLRQEDIHIYAKRKVNGYLNVLKYMKLFENFEKLKSLILNKHQIYAFENSFKRDLTDIYKDKAESLFELCKYFNRKEKTTKFMNIVSDQKIKIIFDQDLKNFLNL